MYESTCDACKRSARQLEGNVPTASQDQRVHFAELVKSRKRESIERLLDRASSINPRNAWASTMPTYFRYAINQVFSRIGWGLRLDVLKHFLDRRFKDKGSTHVFISFNYDLALDRSIECSSDRVWQPRDGYGFEFPFYITMDPVSDSPNHSSGALPTRLLPRSSSAIKILKPHGSLNWLMRRAMPAADCGDPNEMVLPLDQTLQLRYWPSLRNHNFISRTNDLPRDFEILITPPNPEQARLHPGDIVERGNGHTQGRRDLRDRIQFSTNGRRPRDARSRGSEASKDQETDGSEPLRKTRVLPTNQRSIHGADGKRENL